MVHDISLDDLHASPELPDSDHLIYFWDWEGKIHIGRLFVHKEEFSDMFIDLEPGDHQFFYHIKDVPYWKYKI